ncbi:MAG TPA: GIY-YIG nuclease family protein [Gemmatimonadales bacterium]
MWTVYMLRCRDGSLYTGITNDLPKRLARHNAGTASAYTRARRPLRLVFQERQPDRSTALRREAAVRRLTRAGKLALARVSQ